MVFDLGSLNFLIASLCILFESQSLASEDKLHVESLQICMNRMILHYPTLEQLCLDILLTRSRMSLEHNVSLAS